MDSNAIWPITSPRESLPIGSRVTWRGPVGGLVASPIVDLEAAHFELVGTPFQFQKWGFSISEVCRWRSGKKLGNAHFEGVLRALGGLGWGPSPPWVGPWGLGWAG